MQQQRFVVLLLICGCLAFLTACPSPSGLRVPEITEIHDDIFDASLPLPGRPENVEVNSTTNRIYVTYRKHPFLTVIDGETLQTLASVKIPKSSHHLALDIFRNRVYVTNKQKSSVAVIDGNTNTILTTLKVGRWPHSIAVNSRTNRIYVSDEKRAAVHVIDGDTLTVSAHIQVGRKPRGIAVNPTKDLIYVANAKDDTVSILDGKTAEVLNTASVGSEPNFVAVDAILNKAFVSNTGSNNVYVIDGDEYHLVIGVVPVQVNPWGLTVDDAQSRLFVTNRDDHSISVVQTRSHQVLVTGRTQFFPIDVAVDSERSLLYAIHRERSELFIAEITQDE